MRQLGLPEIWAGVRCLLNSGSGLRGVKRGVKYVLASELPELCSVLICGTLVHIDMLLYLP